MDLCRRSPSGAALNRSAVLVPRNPIRRMLTGIGCSAPTAVQVRLRRILTWLPCYRTECKREGAKGGMAGVFMVKSAFYLSRP
ncbi:hypothetical protein GCM10007388_22250 [Pseudoduganella plicata]|uniref:Uncharacterized protein n=1 Tax=Pseudoduganella plicata TaxID=321984 RepID=A0AA88C848_9BURK|nr:hypothetical protein GCM10007388_22250 [Pseudoduganella plicata]